MTNPPENEQQKRTGQDSDQGTDRLGQPPEDGEGSWDADELEPEKPKSPIERLEEWIQQTGRRLRFQQDTGREAKAKSGLRTLVILAGSVAGCLLVFAAMFTTTPGEGGRKDRRSTPRLGRPMTQNEDPQAAERSIVPQLSAGQHAGGEMGELSEGDVLGTMRNRAQAEPKRAPALEDALSNVQFSDPALEQAYRRRGRTPPPGEYVPPEVKPATSTPPAGPPDDREALQRSSIVYVRAVKQDSAGSRPVPSAPAIERKITGLLPPGTRLVARLQHAVSSAVEMPVTAVIEYNYEYDGHLLIPAGSRVYGELAGVTPNGWAEIKFDTLEAPDGRQEKIAGSALNLELGPLRGHVNGKNTAKKFMVRALQGIGSVASYMVGGGSLGQGQIDGSILLRERIADNIARAGEEELRRLAYQEHIVVTVPANTRFYLVLHNRAMTLDDSRAEDGSLQGVAASGISDGELEELVRLRKELQLMNRMMPQSP